MRAFLPRREVATDLSAAEVKTRVPWGHAFQRTSDSRAGWGSAAEGRLALEDLMVGGGEAAGPGGYCELLAVTKMPARATRITVATEVAIESLEMGLVVRAGLGRARLRLELVALVDGDREGEGACRASVDLVELTAVGPDRALRPLSAGPLRVSIACSFAPSHPRPGDLHVGLRASWDVDCGQDGQFRMCGRALAAAPVVTARGPRGDVATARTFSAANRAVLGHPART